MLFRSNKANSIEDAKQKLQLTIEDGSALNKFAEFITAQGGDAKAVYDLSLLPKANIIEELKAKESGYIAKIDCDEIGICSLLLGGGRETKESEIDLSVGLVLNKKTGDKVEKGEALAYIHANDSVKLELAKDRFYQAYHISDKKVEKRTLIKGIVEK